MIIGCLCVKINISDLTKLQKQKNFALFNDGSEQFMPTQRARPWWNPRRGISLRLAIAPSDPNMKYFNYEFNARYFYLTYELKV